MPMGYNKSVADRMRMEPGENLKEKRGGSSQRKIHSEVKESMEILDDYQKQREEWAQHFYEDQQFRTGVQWTAEQTELLKKRGQSPIVVNRIHPIVETAKSLLTFNKPQFRSTGRDDADKKTAKIWSDLAQWVWDVSNGNEELKQVIDDYYVGGMGYTMIYQDAHADMGKGEVLMRNIYPLDVYVDPNARDVYFNDAAHILIARLMTDEQAKKEFPDYWSIIKSAEESDKDRYPGSDLKATEGQTFLPDMTTSSDNIHTHREYIERYTRIKVSRHRVFDQTSGYDTTYDDVEYEAYRAEKAVVIKNEQGENIVTKEEGVQELLQIAEEVGPVFHMTMPQGQQQVQGQGPGPGQGQGQQRPEMAPGPEQDDPNAIPGTTTQIEIITKGDLIDNEVILYNEIRENRIKLVVSVGQKLMYTRILPCEVYPIVPLINVHLRNPYPLSDVRIYKPLQKYINKIRSLIIAHAATSTNVKLLVPRGSVNKKEIEEDWGRAGTAVVEFDAELGAPVVAGPIPLPNELYKNEADAKYDLEYGFGVHDLMMGSSKNAPSTFRGTVAIDEYGQRRSRSRQADMESHLRQCFKVAVPLMQQMYTEEKVIRIVQPDGIQRESTVNQPIIDQYTGQEIGKVHDITSGRYDIIVVGGSTMPSNRWAQLETYMQMYQAGIIDQFEVLKKTEVVDTEGVMQRMSMIQQLQQQNEQLQGELKKVKGDLQTSEREGVHAKKRLEVEKFKSELEKPKEKIKSASALYDARLQDELQKARDGVMNLEKVKSSPQAGKS
ncbi:MAG: hypothetical protein CMI54_00665 [Parcubacteria group bacterium]|jgi:hypothetical protein|nr:hypothetical protein [Parcubacteria group bacterium]|tara:strand:- start:4242 stop:6572 length:2331 start_codon:yes stop_codon:yes gene_type:complete